VEAVVAKHPEVRDCVVDARDDGSGQKRLVAYVVGREGEALAASALRSFLKERLPEYMVPSAFVHLESLPLTPSGKVDRKALPAAEGIRLELPRSIIGPRTALELRLVRLWEELLGVHPIGVRDNFFELGGHSLLAIRLLARIRGSMGRSLPVSALFQKATVEHLASLLGREAGPWSPLVEFRGGGDRRPFFCVHPVGGTVLAYTELASLLGPEQPFHALQSRGLEGEQEPCDTIEAMASLYIEAVRTVQPRGPYLLGGWSMGGSIAYEMARQLQGQGERVELLALIDSHASLFAGGEPPPEENEATRLAALFFKDMLRAAGQEPALSDEALARMEPEEVLGALEESARAAADVLGMGLQPLQALRRVFESNLRAAWRYVPPHYSGSLVSFEASESPREHGWERVVSGEVETHRLEGDHYSILRRPRVEELAARLRGCLERAHAA
jgi:thioesterase domain-containing protein